MDNVGRIVIPRGSIIIYYTLSKVVSEIVDIVSNMFFLSDIPSHTFSIAQPVLEIPLRNIQLKDKASHKLLNESSHIKTLLAVSEAGEQSRGAFSPDTSQEKLEAFWWRSYKRVFLLAFSTAALFCIINDAKQQKHFGNSSNQNKL